eukprot:GDKJ01007213.1.p1 GENE.GDKJ01007213.1~~GDKJ01007213.1.p1  ORF type:complete len:203 (-),score=36.41 GDKJ01007213.1:104-712(-)
MSVAGVWQLQQVVIRYSETGGSSRGLRFWFRHLLPAWQSKNSYVNVQTVHEQFADPKLTCQFINGSETSVSLRNLAPRQIEELLELYRNSSSGNEFLRHGGPRVWTEKRSIQGMWQPSLEGQMEATRWFRRKRPPIRLPKYTAASLALSRQAVQGSGRWGSEREFPKGWDQIHLNRQLKNPILPPNVRAPPQKKVDKQEEKV